ncbi:ABC-2 type transporter-domain-containing protein [Absidia repens]|uniref:ABC-2 type transporter-domain-containing protein n=1 Tax=Absidia repens TaxID=90262 RepID=A0A1X2ISJ6_9FUNG|nr:ABC-2 type transporter-domain-containing protein [Absidia repens]
MDTEGLHEKKQSTVGGDRTIQQPYASTSHCPGDGASLEKIDTAGGFGERDGNAVNIDDAKSNYESLRREMSRQSVATGMIDEEKGAVEQFDLTDFLSGNLARREEEGFKPKRLGLVVKNLTVKGVGADHEWIPTISTVFESALCFWRWGRKSGHDKTILNNVSAYCKPGEMLLVLGRPGAGCTTFLRVLSEMRKGFTEITGDIKYGGIDSKEFGKTYRGEVCYNEEEDINYPTLTASQTLRFAIRCKTPGKRLPGDTKGKFQEKIIYVMGNMLGLTKQMDTMVGNEFVRGLSGGERKRLTIAEQMTTGSCINCWDCSTRGLDASSALDYVRSLRVQTDILQKTTVATLYQASDSIFQLFDHCMVLDGGHCLYFGPASKAKTYFEDMGFHCPSRKSTPDFLTGLCNFMEREARPGFEDKIPMTPHEFEERYKNSTTWQDAQKEMADYESEVEREHPDEDFRQAFVEAHQKHASKRSPFTATPFSQIKALTIRQFELIYGDKGALISRYGGVIVKGIIMASVFYNMPTNASGTFSRGGLLFFSLLFNSLIAQSELSTFMHGRRVLEKHKGYALYRPMYFYIAQVVADVPLAIIQVIIFQLCVYFIASLTLTAGQYFTFMLVLIFSNLCMNGFFRMFGSLSPNFFIASQLSSCVLIALMIYSGYQIPYTQMHPWLMWIYWINPLAYAYKAILENEMHGQHYSCMGDFDHVPSGPSYTDPAYRSCSIHGAGPGATYVLGDDYLQVTYGYASWQRWINFVAVFLFFCLFTIVTALCMEYVELSKGGSQIKVYKRNCAPTEESEEEMRERAKKVGGNKLEAIDNGTTFAWQHIDYTVPVKGGSRQLLNDIGGIVKPGHLTALMGSSGAGKTTLLDVLAKRKTIGKVDGRMYMNGEVLHSDFERVTGYCEQMDIHNPNATVREALQFSAYLRQPAHVSKKEKDEYVEQILDLLEMEPIGNSLIGDPQGMKGISVEERKRLTIGVELVAKPQLLFLDEPTSGLDAQSSYNIVRFIRKLADVGWPVLCTIHQPSATLFSYFDHLLLLVRGGRTAYYGPIGEDSKTMIDYFESHGGQKCSPSANPAEYILEVVGAGTSGHALQDWGDVWEKSQESKDLQNELEEIHSAVDPNLKRHPPTYSLNFLWQLWYVYQRLNVSWWRCPSYNVGRLFKVAFIALISGFSFWKLGDSVVDMNNRLFCIFTTLMMANSLIVLGQPRFMEERQWFRREYASRYYGWAPFAIGTVLVELPYIVVFTALFMFCFYWTAGLQQGSDRIGYFFILFLVFLGFSVSFGFLIASFSTTATMAAVINPFFSSILILFAGIIQPPNNMPHFWSSWMYWLDPYHYLIEGFMVNELYDLTVACTDSDLLTYRPPPGQTCQQYSEEFFSTGGGTGYLTGDSLNSTDLCSYCLYSKGEDYYTRIGWDFQNRWRDWGILLAFWIFNVMAFVFFVWLFRKQRR